MRFLRDICGIWAVCYGVIGLVSGYCGEAPYVSTQPNAWINGSSATLHGMVTPRGASTIAWFEWGATTNYGNASEAVDAGDGQGVFFTAHQISGLTPPVVGHYRLAASNSFGASFGADQLFSVGKNAWYWELPDQIRTIGKPLSTRVVGLSSSPLVSNLTAVCLGAAPVALRADGEVVNLNPPLNPFILPGLSNITAIAYGGGIGPKTDFFLGLTTDGTILEWTNTAASIGPAPTNLDHVVAIAGGLNYGLALKSDGTVVEWGTGSSPASLPSNLTNIVAVAADGSVRLALTDGGNVIQWGPYPIPSAVTNAIAISGGYPMALTKDRKLLAWTPGLFGIAAPIQKFTNISCQALGGNGLILNGGKLVSLFSVLPTPPLIFMFSMFDITPTGLTNPVAVYGGVNSYIALADDAPPSPSTQFTYVNANHDTAIELGASDVNGDPLTISVLALPGKGSLFQYADGRRGAAIIESNTVVTDPQGRLVYAPPAESWGNAFASIKYCAGDGIFVSQPATLMISVTAYAPQVWFSGSTNITTSNATVTAYVQPNSLRTTAWLQWQSLGSTNWTDTPHVDMGNGYLWELTQVVIDGLSPMKAYGIRVAASNALGIVYGDTNALFTSVPLSSVQINPGRIFHSQFTADPHSVFSVWKSTNLTDWEKLGIATERAAGVYQMEDSISTNAPARFYRISSP